MLPLLWTSALPPATGPARLTCTGGASCSYQCGIYPNDYSRFSSDWSQIYQTPYTPTIAPLPWFSVFGEPPRAAVPGSYHRAARVYAATARLATDGCQC